VEVALLHADRQTNGRRDRHRQTDRQTDRQTYGREGNRRFRDLTDKSKNLEVVYKKFNLGGICF